MDFRGVLDYIRSFFGPPLIEPQRKRRAADPLDYYLNPKCRRVHISMANDVDDDSFLSREFTRKSPSIRTSPRLSPRQSRQIDRVVLNDHDDEKFIEIKRPDIDTSQTKSRITKFTSAPENQSNKQEHKPYTNGITNEDEITIIKEIKSPIENKNEASKKGFNNIKPFTGRFLNIGLSHHNGTKPKERTTLFNKITKKSSNSSRPSIHSPGLNLYYRLDDKLQYKTLLETAGSSSSSNDSSIYRTPIGRLFNYDTARRSAKIRNMLSKPKNASILNISKEPMSTKDRIIKILDDFDPLEIKDSDSDSEVLVNCPSPKPDIKVEPVNNFKKVVDTSQQTNSDWLHELVDRHRSFVVRRQKEIELRECSEKHGKINKDTGCDAIKEDSMRDVNR